MNHLLVFCLLSLVALSMAGTDLHPRGCIYALGKCVSDCPEGTHAYAVGCAQRLPEPTCDVPTPVKEEAIICDYSSCYCDPPTVRDTKSGKCMPLEECPKKEEEKEEEKEE